MILQTERLLLREMTQEDFPALCRILQDEQTMYAYEGAFSDSEAQVWLDRQLERYRQLGFGLWAVILKQTGEMIGQCGLTMQPWKGQELLRNGMHKADRMVKHYRGVDMPHDRYVVFRTPLLEEQ